MSVKSTIAFVAAATAALLATCIANAADSVTLKKVQTISVTVESIDAGDLVWLRDDDGRSLRMHIPSDVRHDGGITVGDRLTVKYKESIVASVTRKGSRDSRNDRGSTDGISRSGVVQSVDKLEHTISYKDADGFSRDATINDRDAQKFIETLKPGDEVEVTYSDAFAVSVEKQK